MKVYIDEAWRGPLAWPIYCWLIFPVVFSKEIRQMWFIDSKKLTANKREKMYKKIRQLEREWVLYYSYSYISNYEIDKLWLSYSIQKLLISWIRNILKKSWKKLKDINEIVFDWNTDFWVWKKIWKKVKTVKKWDIKVLQISMASIVAKVLRDRYMKIQAKHYPNYDFSNNKWYWTAKHLEAIKNFWIIKLHRKSFLKNIPK